MDVTQDNIPTPTLQEIKAARAVFEERESRDLFYRPATELVGPRSARANRADPHRGRPTSDCEQRSRCMEFPYRPSRSSLTITSTWSSS
jgi:hypothetical protein